MSPFVLAVIPLLFAFQFQTASAAEFSGRVRLEAQSFFAKPPPSVTDPLGFLVAEFEARDALSENWRWRFEPRARFASASGVMQEDADFDPRDTHLEGRFGSLRLQAGSFVKVWEGTDGVNPMDIASMKNLRDPLAIEPLASMGIALSGDGDFFTWDLVLVPRQTPSRLPGSRSAWWPRWERLPLQTEDLVLLLPDDPVYEIRDRIELDRALSNNVGIRARLHGESWDFSLAAFEGLAQTPMLIPTDLSLELVEVFPVLRLQAANPISIVPMDYRRRTVSGAFVHAFGTWIVRAAGRHDLPLGDAAEALTWTDQYVLGVEKTVAIGDESVVFLLQGASARRPETENLLSGTDVFKEAALYGVRWPWGESHLFTFAGFTDLPTGAVYSRLAYQLKITDSVSVETVADLLQGPDFTLVGAFANQSRGTVTLQAQF